MKSQRPASQRKGTRHSADCQNLGQNLTNPFSLPLRNSKQIVKESKKYCWRNPKNFNHKLKNPSQRKGTGRRLSKFGSEFNKLFLLKTLFDFCQNLTNIFLFKTPFDFPQEKHFHELLPKERHLGQIKKIPVDWGLNFWI